MNPRLTTTDPLPRSPVLLAREHRNQWGFFYIPLGYEYACGLLDQIHGMESERTVPETIPGAGYRQFTDCRMNSNRIVLPGQVESNVSYVTADLVRRHEPDLATAPVVVWQTAVTDPRHEPPASQDVTEGPHPVRSWPVPPWTIAVAALLTAPSEEVGPRFREWALHDEHLAAEVLIHGVRLTEPPDDGLAPGRYITPMLDPQDLEPLLESERGWIREAAIRALGEIKLARPNRHGPGR